MLLSENALKVCSWAFRTFKAESTTSFPHCLGNNSPPRIFNECSYLWCLCVQMSRFLDMAEFGEAAHYLRLTNLEQLAAKAQAFDGPCFLFIFLCTRGGKYRQSVLKYKKRYWCKKTTPVKVKVVIQLLCLSTAALRCSCPSWVPSSTLRLYSLCCFYTRRYEGGIQWLNLSIITQLPINLCYTTAVHQSHTVL